MKTISLVILIAFSISAFGQVNELGGEISVNPETTCISEIEREAIKIDLKKQVEKLQSKGIIPSSPKKNNIITLFDWPLKPASDLFYDSYFGVSNYVDQDNSTGIEDYNCGSITYNGHLGTDFFTYPYPWFLVENELVEVVAAADGIIISKSDGNDDDHCIPSGMWNAVYLQHSDGSQTWYGHLKKNSLTSKSIGQSVVAGEYLGIVASSGNSTGPHLHFEVYDSADNLIDPYAGTCNNLNPNSWWSSQPGYSDSKINALLTHYDVPSQGCPGTNEAIRLSNNFYSGQLVRIAAYYINENINDLTIFKLKRPDGSVYQQWNHFSNSNYPASWWYYSRTLPANGPFGEWIVEADYNGTIYTHSFRYLDSNCTNQAVNTWIGPNNGTWNFNSNNWSLGYVPSACDIVQIPANKQVSLVDGEEYFCYKLEIGVGAELLIHPNNIMNVSVQP